MTAIEKDTNPSNQAEKLSRKNSTYGLDAAPDMLEAPLGANRPVETLPDGSHVIMFWKARNCKPARGQVIVSGRKTVGMFPTKSAGRELIKAGVDQGYVSKVDQATMLKQIEESTLPE